MSDEVSKSDANNRRTMLGIDNSSDKELVTPRFDATTKRHLVDALSILDGYDNVGDGTATVTTAGTRVQLANISCKRVFIQAREDNSGTIVVGGLTVVAAVATRRGLALFATQGQWFYVSNTNLLYIESTSSGDIVNFYYEN